MANIFTRINDIINANVNDLVDRLEDPERMIKQVIREMEENINQSKEGVIDAIASEKQLLRELESQRRQSEGWLKKAQLALEAENEELARSALARKKEVDSIIKNLEPAWESAKATSERLKRQLHQLEAKLEEAKLKRSTLIARQRATQARQQMYKTEDKFQSSLDAQTRFDRMEDKVGYMESRTDALAELEGESSPLEKEFLQMEVDNDVEMELEALKVKVQKKRA
ncbi:PspA/IM30 [Candidatus Thiomargarita nelsonii]|uniref:PspA/IM30 n=1 Tax=Candidatus Thiomargarita nelsonii TaxID=1003181 RepID=A0A0A6NZY4_9GAMM|nr:PspA/IM30 [Candidatus Thiomargarita nelsonii]